MAAVPVTVAPTRPHEAAPQEDTAVTVIDSLDAVMDSVACSCAAGDDNPH